MAPMPVVILISLFDLLLEISEEVVLGFVLEDALDLVMDGTDERRRKEKSQASERMWLIPIHIAGRGNAMLVIDRSASEAYNKVRGTSTELSDRLYWQKR
jgi:hypothetical protein